MAKRRASWGKLEVSKAPSTTGTVCAYCGKQCFTNRKLAKLAGRARHPGHHLTAYQCTDAPDGADLDKHWHYGHLQGSVLKGVKARSQIAAQAPLVRNNLPRKGIPADIRATIRKIDTDSKDADGQEAERR